MRMYNGNFPQGMERLSYLVPTMATDELAMWGAMASAATELALFSWYIPIPATKGAFIYYFCSTFKMNANAV